VNRTRWLITAVAAFVIVLGGGAALAANGSNDPAPDFLGDVAKRLGIGRDKLEDAVEDARIARIDAAVAAGDLTKKQGEKLKEHVRADEFPAILPGLRGGPGSGIAPIDRPRLPVPGPPGADFLGGAGDYLGMDRAELREALVDGKSLAELAKDKGKSVDGLKQALRDEVRENADRAVEDGVLTSEQADRFVEKFGRAIDAFVEDGLKGGFGFGYEGRDGNFEFHLRIGPGDRIPRPEFRKPSFEPGIVAPGVM
jgi:hypothetical protein